MGGRAFAAVVAGCVLFGGGVAAAQPEPDPTKQCKKGRLVGTGPAQFADENNNGFVCVDPTTGEISDDKEQFAPDEPGTFAADQNRDFIVCYNEQSGVVTDNRDPGAEGDFCPPGFQPYPAVFFP